MTLRITDNCSFFAEEDACACEQSCPVLLKMLKAKYLGKYIEIVNSRQLGKLSKVDLKGTRPEMSLLPRSEDASGRGKCPSHVSQTTSASVGSLDKLFIPSFCVFAQAVPFAQSTPHPHLLIYFLVCSSATLQALP